MLSGGRLPSTHPPAPTPPYSRPTAFEDVGVRLHEMSLKGQWEEMTGLITDEILDKFAVAVEYGDVAAAVKERYDGLLNEVVFGMDIMGADDEQILRRIVSELQE